MFKCKFMFMCLMLLVLCFCFVLNEVVNCVIVFFDIFVIGEVGLQIGEEIGFLLNVFFFEDWSNSLSCFFCMVEGNVFMLCQLWYYMVSQKKYLWEYMVNNMVFNDIMENVVIDEVKVMVDGRCSFFDEGLLVCFVMYGFGVCVV